MKRVLISLGLLLFFLFFTLKMTNAHNAFKFSNTINQFENNTQNISLGIIVNVPQTMLCERSEKIPIFITLFWKNNASLINSARVLINYRRRQKNCKKVYKGTFVCFFKVKGNSFYKISVHAFVNNRSLLKIFNFKTTYNGEFCVNREFTPSANPEFGPVVMTLVFQKIGKTKNEKCEVIDKIPVASEVEDVLNGSVFERDCQKFVAFRNITKNSKMVYLLKVPNKKGMVYRIGPLKIKCGKKVYLIKNLAYIFSDPIKYKDAFFIYGDQSDFIKYQVYDGTSLSPPYSALDSLGVPLWIETASNPLKPEMVMGVIDSNGIAYAEVWNGHTWYNGTILTTSAITTSRGIDVAYEHLSGRALVVYSDGTSIPKYKIWDGLSWSAQGSALSVGTSTVEFIQLGSETVNNQIIMVTEDSGNDEYAQVWTGTGWTDLTALDLNGYYDRQGVAIACMVNGTCFVFYTDKNYANAYYAIWNTTAFSATDLTACNFGPYLATGWGNFYYYDASTLEAAADPNLNRVALIGTDDNGDVNFCFYNGNSWTNLGYTSVGAQYVYQDLDVKFIPKTGDVMFVYDIGTATPDYQILPNGSTTLTSATAIGTFNAEPYWMRLAAKPDSDELALILTTSLNTTYGLIWNGTTWINEGALSLSTNYAGRAIAVEFPKEYLPPYYTVWGITDGSKIYKTGNVIHRGQILKAYVKWSSVTSAVMQHNGTGTFQNYTVPLPYTDYWTNYTINTSNDLEFPHTGAINFSVYGKDVDSAWNETTPISLILWGYGKLSYIGLNTTKIINGSAVNIVCRVIDNETLAGVQNYIVYFYRNSTLLGSNITNANGYAVFTYLDNTTDPLNPTVYKISCLIKNQPNIFYNASSQNTVSSYLYVYNATYDVYPPTINWVKAVPNPAGFGVNMSIVANITDNRVVASALLTITMPNATSFTLLMQNVSDTWYANFTPWIVGNYTYTIEAKDAANNIAYYTGSFLVSSNATITVSTDKTTYPPYDLVYLSGEIDYGPLNINNQTTELTTFYGGDPLYLRIGESSAASTGGTVTFTTSLPSSNYSVVMNAYYANLYYSYMPLYQLKQANSFDMICRDDTGTDTACTFDYFTSMIGEFERAGMIIKAGNGTTDTTGYTTITFKTPMPTTNYAIIMTPKDPGTGGYVMMYTQKTENNFTALCMDDKGNPASCDFNWVAIPYGVYNLGNLIIEVGNASTDSNGDATVTLPQAMPTTYYATLMTAQYLTDTAVVMFVNKYINSFTVYIGDDKGLGVSTNFDYLVANYGEYDLTQAKSIDAESSPEQYKLYNGSFQSLYALKLKIQVDAYYSYASYLNNDTFPDISIYAYNGTSFVYEGELNVNNFYSGVGLNTTQHNFTIEITDPNVMREWLSNPNKRYIELKGMYLDSYNQTIIDYINYSQIWITFIEKPNSEIKNTGSTKIGGYLSIEVQRYNGTDWQTIDKVVNGLGNYNETIILPNQTINLSKIWVDNGAWNTSYWEGYFRIKAVLSDPSGKAIVDSNGNKIVAYWPFQVQLFKNINATPPHTGYGEPETLYADVSQPSLITGIGVYVTNPDGKTVYLNVANITQSVFQTNYTNTWEKGLYTFIFSANTTYGTEVNSTPHYFYINATVEVKTFVSRDNKTYGPLEYVYVKPLINNWWNRSWEYRVKVNITIDKFSHTNFPIQIQLNFTKLFQEAECSNCEFDINSIRVIEYNNTTLMPMYQLPFMFYPNSSFNALSNAVGDVVWILNGTTAPNTTRIFYIYFDRLANGPKPKPTYNFSVKYNPLSHGIMIDNQYVLVFSPNNEISQIYVLGNASADLSSGDSSGGRDLWYWSYDYWSGTTYDLMNPLYFKPMISYGPMVWINASEDNGGRITSAIIEVYKRTNHSWVLWLHDWHNVFNVAGGNALVEHFINIQKDSNGYLTVRNCTISATGTVSCVTIPTSTTNGGVDVEGANWVDAEFYGSPTVPDFYITYILKKGNFVGFDKVPWEWSVEAIDTTPSIFFPTFDRFALTDNSSQAVPAGTNFTRDVFILITTDAGGFTETEQMFKEVYDWPKISVGKGEYLKESTVTDKGEVPFKFYVEMRVQRLENGVWVNIGLPVVDDRYNGVERELTPGNLLDLSKLWNATGWYTDDEPPGTYRVLTRLLDPNGNILLDSNNLPLEFSDKFYIIPAELKLTKLTYENLHDYGINEYETGDNIAWVNVTITNYNVTAINATVNLNVLNPALSQVSWGPSGLKICGNLTPLQSCTVKYDNNSNGYIIPLDATPGEYTFYWNVTLQAENAKTVVNYSNTFVVFNLPSYFGSSINPTKILNGSWANYTFWMYNPFSKNLTQVNITINCPVNFTCKCENTNLPYCYVGNLTALTNLTVWFNVSTTPTTSVGLYNVNVTVHYINPGNETHVWKKVQNQIFYVKEPYLDVEITNYSQSLTRGVASNILLAGYVNNTYNQTVYNLTFNWTLPSGWTNTTGNLKSFVTSLNPGEITWNNITVNVSTSANLGKQLIELKAENLKYVDFDFKYVYVYANTYILNYVNDTNPQIGETILVEGILKYDNGTPISGENLTFYDQTANKYLGYGITNANGIAYVTYTIPYTAQLGNHTLNISFSGDSLLYLNPSFTRFNITIHDVPVFNWVNISPEAQGYGFNVSITANVTDREGVSYVLAYVTFPNSTVKKYLMKEIEPNIYQYNFSYTWLEGFYKIVLWANNTASKYNQTIPYDFLGEANVTATLKTDKTAYKQNQNVSLTPQQIDWWNRSWPFRVRINVTNPSAYNVTNYPLDVVIYHNGHAKPNCEDIRIVDNSTGNVVPDYIVSCNSTAAVVRFLVNITSYQKKVYFAYYGNLQAKDYDIYLSRTVSVNWQTPHPYPALVDSWNCTLAGCFAGVPVYKAPFSSPGNVEGRVYMKVIVEGALSDPFYIYDGSQLTQFFVFDPGGAAGTPSYWNNGYYGWSLWYDTDSFTFHFVSNSQYEYWGVDVVKAEFDLINKLNVSVGNEEPIYNQILDIGKTAFKGYLVMKVQRYTGTSWVDVASVINSTYFNLSSQEYLDLDSIWNAIKWNTGNNPAGLYRIVAFVTDPFGNIEENDNTSLMLFTTEFRILPPPVVLSITSIKIYNVTGVQNPTINTSYLVGSGVNTTFLLFTNTTYRFDINVYNNLTSTNDWWINTSSFIKYLGLDPLWQTDPLNYIWYDILGINYIGGNYTLGNISWDNDLGGVLNIGSSMTFSFIINTTSNKTEILPVEFIINGTNFILKDNSLLKVVRSEKIPPKLFNNTYGITPISVIRNYNSTKIYARWNEEIREAKFEFQYNKTAWINKTIDYNILAVPSLNPYNWTNYTIFVNLSWPVGIHYAKIEAADDNLNWNTTLPYLQFAVYGLANIGDGYASPNPVVYGHNTSLICRVTADNGSGIPGVIVVFYNSSGSIGTATTNATGYATFYNYTATTLGYSTIKCSIYTQSLTSLYYKANKSVAYFTLWTIETTPPDYFNVSQNASIVHKGDTVSLKAYWTDNYQLQAAWLLTNATGNYTINKTIFFSGTGNWSNFTYIIPLSMKPATLGWKIYANDTSGNINNSMPANEIQVWGWAEIPNNFINKKAFLLPPSITPGGNTTMYCQVLDTNGTGIANYPVTFYLQNNTNTIYLGSNTTNATGWAQYSFSATQNGTYYVICNITDDSDLMYNATSQNTGTATLVVANDTVPPYLFNNTYDLNATSIYKGQALLIYARWNESIGNATVIYNSTTSTLNAYLLSVPTPNLNPYNWTNYTILTDAYWKVGIHYAKIEAADVIGNWNTTLPYLTFQVWGYSQPLIISPGLNVNRSNAIPIICKVIDTYSKQGIANYPVSIWIDYVYITTVYTNATGYATYLWNAESYAPGQHLIQCIISSNNTLYYTVSTTTASETITLWGKLYANILKPLNNQILWKGELTFLNATVYEDNSSPIVPTYSDWYLNSTNIATTTNATWQVPYTQTVGNYTLWTNESQQYFYPANTSINVSIFGFAKINWIYPPNGSSFNQYTTVPLICRVNDTYTGAGIADYPVYFYVENSTDIWYLGSALTNATGYATLNWNIGSSFSNGTYYPVCNITNEYGLFYFASRINNANTTIYVNSSNITAWISVKLNEPLVNSTTIVAQNRTFLINATISCFSGNCGNVLITARYNATSSVNPDTVITNTTGKPFYIIGNYIKNCTLLNGENCTVTFLINATGNISSIYLIDVNASSSYTLENKSGNAYIDIEYILLMNVTPAYIDTWYIPYPNGTYPSYTVNSVGPNTTGVKSGEAIVVELYPNSSDANGGLWVKATNLTEYPSGNYYIPAKDMGWLFGFPSDYPTVPTSINKLNTTWKQILSYLPAGYKVNLTLFVNVPPVEAASYIGAVTFMVNGTY